MSLLTAFGLTLLVSFSVMAQDTKVCAWILETKQPDHFNQFDLWLQADGELDFHYKIGGEGIVNQSSNFHSPASGSFVLHAGKAAKPWGLGGTVWPPSKIDFTVELRKPPASIFSDEVTPLLARFVFQRDVPESETKAPPVFARKQCATVKQEK
jgi:hypothetical protein